MAKTSDTSKPRIFSYVVLRDFGFAPNPFHGTCTLATCKPGIRRAATVGDWVFGTGSKQVGREGRLVYAMRVDSILGFDEYWDDPRFFYKRPRLNGSLVQIFGDNIYHRDPTSKEWIQEDSHHSRKDGTPDPINVARDTKSTQVLVSRHFAYFGCMAPEIPPDLRNVGGNDLCKSGLGHKANFTEPHIEAALEWVEPQLGGDGCYDDPFDWKDAQRKQLDLW